MAIRGEIDAQAERVVRPLLRALGTELGKHARSAVGHVALPRGIAVEINGEFELVSP